MYATVQDKYQRRSLVSIHRQLMMDFSMKITFALLLISLQLDGGDFSPSVERPESSKSPHRLHRSKSGMASLKYNSDKPHEKNDVTIVVQSANEGNSNLEWVTSANAEVPKNAVTVEDKENKYYIAKNKDCHICFFDKDKQSCVTWLPEKRKQTDSVSYESIMFLVNRDNFEITEWKECTNQKIPPMPVESCNGFFIAINAFGYTTMTAAGLMKNPVCKVLTLNNDYKMQHINIVEYLIESVVTSENLEVLKHFQASNRNCEPSKHTVKFDQSIDKTSTYQIGSTHTFGANAEISVNGTIPSIGKVGGKFGLKYDYSRPRSNTTSVVEKTLHSVSMDVNVPANHSCTIDIMSNTFTAEVPFTGEITRIYKNNEKRKTFINGTYIHQEVAEIQTLVNPCEPLFDGRRC